MGIIIAIPAIAILSYWAYLSRENSPKVHDSYYGINLGDTKDQMLFRLGKPTKDRNNVCEYDRNDYSVIISFRDDKIWLVQAQLLTEFGFLDNLNNVSSHTDLETVFKRNGRQADTSISTDGLWRFYSFPKYHVFYLLAKNEVVSMGIYDPKYGPVQFAKLNT